MEKILQTVVPLAGTLEIFKRLDVTLAQYPSRLREFQLWDEHRLEYRQFRNRVGRIAVQSELILDRLLLLVVRRDEAPNVKSDLNHQAWTKLHYYFWDGLPDKRQYQRYIRMVKQLYQDIDELQKALQRWLRSSAREEAGAMKTARDHFNSNTSLGRAERSVQSFFGLCVKIEHLTNPDTNSKIQRTGGFQYNSLGMDRKRMEDALPGAGEDMHIRLAQAISRRRIHLHHTYQELIDRADPSGIKSTAEMPQRGVKCKELVVVEHLAQHFDVLSPVLKTHGTVQLDDCSVEFNAEAYCPLGNYSPDFGKDRYAMSNEFTCPFCRKAQSHVSRNDQMREHILGDLWAYVCTHNECDPLMFPSKNDWLNHEMDDHCANFQCPYCQDERVFFSRAEIGDHLSDHHSPEFLQEQLEGIIDYTECALHTMRLSDCPFCGWRPERTGIGKRTQDSNDEIYVTPAEYREHVGKHFEDIAWKTVPMDYKMGDERLSLSLSKILVDPNIQRSRTFAGDLRVALENDNAIVQSKGLAVPSKRSARSPSIQSPSPWIKMPQGAGGHNAYKLSRSYEPPSPAPMASRDGPLGMHQDVTALHLRVGIDAELQTADAAAVETPLSLLSLTSSMSSRTNSCGPEQSSPTNSDIFHFEEEAEQSMPRE